MIGGAGMKLGRRLTRKFFAREPDQVARDLIGTYLIRYTADGRRLGGKIVETEAYLATGDPASHSVRGKTARNRSMFAKPGTLYVYSIHARYCMNVATESEEIGSAVLIRAVQPLWGIQEMSAARRQTDLRKLTRGPAMLCEALGISTVDDGTDLIGCRWLAMRGAEQSQETMKTGLQVGCGGRIGISAGIDLPLRFYELGSIWLSR
jgi:DNA-3-methyladenine glycosylase